MLAMTMTPLEMLKQKQNFSTAIVRVEEEVKCRRKCF